MLDESFKAPPYTLCRAEEPKHVICQYPDCDCESKDKIAALLALREVRINIGCGVNKFEEYINVDVQESENAKGELIVPDLSADARRIPLPDGCAHEVMAIHIFEHFYRWEVEEVLAEWKRLLRPRGLLVLELPDIIKCTRNVFKEIEGVKHPDQLGLWGLYGDPRSKNPYMVHKWGWSPATITALLEENGFGPVRVMPTLYHATGRLKRDMRVEARKISE